MKYLGQDTRTPQGELDTFPVPSGGVGMVELRSDEISALCPVTGQPDWYRVTIKYRPRDVCLESKSLKLYFWLFREKGLFCESFSRQIFNDMREALRNPPFLHVTVEMKSRGGITIKAETFK
ncbi:MAG: preQ(1) synthase [Euryarchaeota archaeon]|nr:preQ(1) synthase [Euryarchaeota archaeon]